jgi:hypothetical protein
MAKKWNTSGYPQGVVDAIKRAHAEHPDDAAAAISAAMQAARALPEFMEWALRLAKNQVSEGLYDHRHELNVAAKKAAGLYGGPAKVSGVSKEIDESYKKVYEKVYKQSAEKKK